MTASDTLDKAGQFLMEHLRDAGLGFADGLIAGRWKAPALKPLQEELASLSDAHKELVRRCVRASLDRAIHDLLFKLGETADFDNDVQLLVDGRNVAPLSDGLQAEPFGPDGWQARFSRYGAAKE